MTQDMRDQPSNDQDASGKQVIARAAAVLKALEGQAEGLTIAEITRASGLPRTTAQRIALALQGQQMVVAVDGRIRLGPAITRLAGSTHLDVVAIARPHIEALSRTTRETVNLSVLRGNHAVLVDQVVSDHELRVVSPVGSALPVYCTAHGKALLAAMDDAEVRQRLAGPWVLKTERTIPSLEALIAALAPLRAGAPCLDEGEHLEGVCGIGAVLPIPTSERYALSVVMPASRFAGQRGAIVAALAGTTSSIAACFA
jgi:IclR family transcriptional regulator, acetate operon repressor